MVSAGDQKEAFLREVVGDIDSDEPRLIYADYLEELGDPRGEFIRLQCELERLDRYDPSFIEKECRVDLLRQRHAASWAKELKQNVQKTEFRRGFIDTLTIRAGTFLKNADQLFDSVPVQWLRLTFLKDQGRNLAQSPALSRVRCLDVSNLQVPREDLIELLTSPHLHQLRALKLGGFDWSVDESFGKAISKSHWFDSIRTLHIAVQPGFLPALGRDRLANLRHLKISSNHGQHVSSWMEDLESLSGIPLETLEVDDPYMRNDGRVFAGMTLSHLKRLAIQSYLSSDRFFIHLADAGAFKNVQSLELPATATQPGSAERIFCDGHLSECRNLQFAFGGYRRRADAKMNRVVDRIASMGELAACERVTIRNLTTSRWPALFDSALFQGLRSLHLSDGQLNGNAWDALGNSSCRESLCELTFDHCEWDGGAEPIVRLEWPHLLRLMLMRRWKRAESQKLLATEGMPVLQSIWLGYHLNCLPDAVLADLAESGRFPELREIEFQSRQVSPESAEAFFDGADRERFCRIIASGKVITRP